MIYPGSLLDALVPEDAVLRGSRAVFRGQVLSAFSAGSRSVHPRMDLRTAEAASMLDGVVSVNLAQMSRAGLPRGVFPVLQGIQQRRVRYERLDPDEHWQTWRELVSQMGGLGVVHVGEGGRVSFGGSGVARGDCEDLSTAVTAELLYNGVPARTYVYKSGPRLYHVVVKTDRWGLLDPSRAAGMGGNG